MSANHATRGRRLRPVQVILCAALAAGSAFADIVENPRFREEDEAGPGKVLKKIGNFFINLAKKLEDLDQTRPPLPPLSESPPRSSRKSSQKAPTKSPPPKTRYLNESNARPEQRAQIEKKPSKATPPLPKLPGPPPETLEPTPPLNPKPASDTKPRKSGGAPSEEIAEPKPSTVKPGPSHIPTAGRTNKFGRVKSPFPPYIELDVSGMGSGSLAKDPTTGGIFRVP